MSAPPASVPAASEPWIPSSSSRAEVQSHRWPRFLFVYGIPLFIASLLRTGYSVNLGHHVIQIPLVYLLNDPSLYPHDPFAATLPSYPSLFWPVVAWIARMVPLGWLLGLLFLCERALVLYAAGRLARTFSSSSEIAAVGAMAIFAAGIQPFVGNGTIVENYTEQTGFAIPFFLLGIAAFYSRSPVAAAVWLAVGCNMNVLYGIFTLSYLGSVCLLDPEYRRAWRSWAPAAGLFVVLICPVIVATLLAFRHEAAEDALWYIAAKVRSAHHLFPLSWNKHALGMQIGLMAVFSTIFFRRRQDLPTLSRHARIWTGVGVGWLVLAFVVAYAVKMPSLLVIQAGRALDVWLCFASILLVSVIVGGVEDGTRDGRILSLGALAGCLLVWTPDLSASVVGLGLLLLASKPLRQWVIAADAGRVALAIVACSFVIGADSTVSRFMARATLQETFVAQPPSAMADIAQWARRNTPPDAVFLTDPTWGSFRALSQRPVFVTFEDGAAILWQRSFVREWVDRLHAIGLDVRDGARLGNPPTINAWQTRTYESLRDTDAGRLSASHSVQYWVVSREHLSAFPVVYQAGSNKVLRVQ